MQKKQNSTALMWFKNDLRTHDNEALYNACKNHEQVIAVFYFEPALFETKQFGFKKIDVFRTQFLIETVTQLQETLQQLNITLLTYYKSPETHITELCNSYGIDAIYYQHEWTSEEVSVINNVKAALPENVSMHGYYNQFLYHPEDCPFSVEQIPKVFTAFRKKVEKYATIRPVFSAEAKSKTNRLDTQRPIPSLSDLGFSDYNKHPNTAFPFKGGETNAFERLHSYFFETKQLGVYKKTRNGLVGTDYSSKFSPWLANGSLSPRTIYWQVKQFENKEFKNDSTYWLIFELIWRDFFKYISLKHGNSLFKLKGILNKTYDWSNNSEQINHWINGNTTEPFVNANMLELKHTGWMSNRGRQNVASYFAKTLQLDWRIGAAYFESLLLDYDVHSNYGNWLYVSGVGNDPRDRTFNVKLQAERYDSKGIFQRLWLQPTLFSNTL